jgi:hypothetical protein
MSSRARVLPVLCLAFVLSFGCGGEPPDKEMQQAQGAIDAARAAGADKYATDEFAAAQTALKNANDAVTQRDYRLALNHALDSRERAQNAAKMAADGMATARVDADRALTAAAQTLAEADNQLKAAEAAKTPARSLDAPRNTIEAARTQVQEARAIFERGDYLDVPARAKAATATIPEALQAIDAARTPAPRRRR